MDCRIGASETGTPRWWATVRAPFHRLLLSTGADAMTDPGATGLFEFIQINLESILQEWEEFARSLAPLAGMDQRALRDHAEAMLDAVVVDMCERQSERQRRAKSEGMDASPEAGLDQAAQLHAVARLHDQFSL